mmetsp:Transcript_205/g.432  ORF Transcript_205/g.432 Transcript_205/m.432 type:complete len:213 (-) Transcript_205:52-690(-)
MPGVAEVDHDTASRHDSLHCLLGPWLLLAGAPVGAKSHSCCAILRSEVRQRPDGGDLGLNASLEVQKESPAISVQRLPAVAFANADDLREAQLERQALASRHEAAREVLLSLQIQDLPAQDPLAELQQHRVPQDLPAGLGARGHRAGAAGLAAQEAVARRGRVNVGPHLLDHARARLAAHQPLHHHGAVPQQCREHPQRWLRGPAVHKARRQ